MKKILIVIILLLTVFLIYTGFKDEKFYYFNIGDEIALGTNSIGNSDYGYFDVVRDFLKNEKKLKNFANYSSKGIHTTDIINDIEANVFVNVEDKQKRIQHVLIKADIVTISVGRNDFLKNITINEEFTINDLYNTFDETIDDLDKLFKLLRQYCKEEIIFIGFYNTTDNNLDQFFNYVNSRMDGLTNKYNIKYINTYKLIKSNKSVYPTKESYIELGNEIVKKIKLTK